jgi:hypothetical protein
MTQQQAEPVAQLINMWQESQHMCAYQMTSAWFF